VDATKRAFFSALAFGLPKEEAEDVAGHVALKRLQGIGLDQSASQSVIDYLRSVGHSTRNGRPGYFDKTLPVEDAHLATYPDAELLSLVLSFLKQCTQRERVVFVLYYVWGMTMGEIAFAFGLNEGYMANMMPELRRKLFTFANS